jgi:hypothetical protein
VAFGYLCLLEHGKRVPSVAVAEALVETYGLTSSEAALLRSAALEGVGRSFDPRRYESAPEPEYEWARSEDDSSPADRVARRRVEGTVMDAEPIKRKARTKRIRTVGW